jgi:hypothetical protein
MGLIVLGVLMAVGGLMTVPIRVPPPYVDPKRSGRLLLYSGLAMAMLGVLQELLTPG